ncbi:C-type lectin domain family 4 member A-like isoform X2 [Mustelus asterias]
MKNFKNNRTTRSAAEPETTYAQIAVRSQSAQHNPGSEVTPGKDQRQQETAGGTNSKKSRCLGLVAILIMISLFATIIGLTLYVVKKDLRRCNEELVQHQRIIHWLCPYVRNCSESHCPCGWKVHNQSCYRISKTKINWDAAKRKCEYLNSHLLIIDTQQEESFVIQSMPDKEIQYLIGLTDRGNEGNWSWVDGTPVSSPRWWEDQPDNADGNENCGAIGRDFKTNKFGWNDVPCSLEFNFMCEKRAPSCIGAADFEKYCP